MCANIGEHKIKHTTSNVLKAQTFICVVGIGHFIPKKIFLAESRV